MNEQTMTYQPHDHIFEKGMVIYENSNWNVRKGNIKRWPIEFGLDYQTFSGRSAQMKINFIIVMILACIMVLEACKKKIGVVTKCCVANMDRP